MGAGQTGPVCVDPRSIPEMVLSAVERALSDAGLGYGDIDAVVTASVDLLDGLTASSVGVTEVVGAVMRPETRIAADGLCAAVHAACQIWCGAYDTVLVVAHGKASMAPHPALTAWAMDPVRVQPLRADFLVCAGIQARVVAGEDDGAPSRWAETVAARLRAAGDHGLSSVCDVDDILASPPAASPITERMCAPEGDGASAVVLTARDIAATEGAVRLTGVGHDLEPHSLGDRDLAEWSGLRRACQRAYRVAGIASAGDAFDLAEPSCRFPHEEELFIHASGVGSGAALSPTGGLFAGAVPVAAGLSRLVAATERMRESRERRRALVHGAWGPAGQGQAVAVVEAGP